MKHSFVSLVSLALLALPCAAQRAVLVVDSSNGPGTDFTSLQPAINAAKKGDLLLLRKGSYHGSIKAKSIGLQAEQPGVPYLSVLSIKDISASQSVVIRDCRGGVPDVRRCSGPVHFDGGAYPEIDCTDCADVVLRGVIVYGASYGVCYGGLRTTRSSVYVYESFLAGEPAFHFTGGGMGVPDCRGSAGVEMVDSTVYLQGTRVRGGDEEWPYRASPGIHARGPLRSLELVDSLVTAGKSKTLTPASIYQGVKPSIRPSHARRMDLLSPVIEGQKAIASIHGQPGDFVFVAISPTPGATRYYLVAGAYHGDLSSTVLMGAGTIPASGVLWMTYTAPTYIGPDTVTPLYMQPLFVRPGEKLLGAPTHQYVLDPNY